MSLRINSSPLEIPQRSAKVSPSPASDPERLAGAVASEGSPKPRNKLWRRVLTRRNKILLACLVFLLVAGFLAVAVLYNFGYYYANAQLSPKDNGVAIIGEVTRFDLLDTYQLSVTWFVVGRGEYELQGVDRHCNEHIPANRAVDIYLDDASKPVFSYSPFQLPVSKTGERLCPLNLVSFVMGHRTTTVRQYATPFDLYDFTMFAFVVESATNESAPFAVFAVGDSGPVDLTTISVEEQTRNNFTYVTKNGPTTVEVESRTILAKVVHSTRAVALTLSMFIINWVMTLCSVVIAFIVFRRRGAEVKGGVAFLPITVILSIPTIRSLYVGSPPFGILLDVVGFFPQMVTVVVRAMVVLGVFVMRPTRDRLNTPDKVEDGTSAPPGL